MIQLAFPENATLLWWNYDVLCLKFATVLLQFLVLVLYFLSANALAISVLWYILFCSTNALALGPHCFLSKELPLLHRVLKESRF